MDAYWSMSACMLLSSTMSYLMSTNSQISNLLLEAAFCLLIADNQYNN